MTAEFVKCPLCGDPERTEELVGGVCLSCADGIAFSQNARRGAIRVPVGPPQGPDTTRPEYPKVWDAYLVIAMFAAIDVILLLIVLGVLR